MVESRHRCFDKPSRHARFVPDNINWRLRTRTTAIVGTVAGAVGIWAVATHNVRGAKLFLWSCLPKYLGDLALVAVRRHKAQQYDLGVGTWGMNLGDVFSVILVAYYVKVSKVTMVFGGNVLLYQGRLEKKILDPHSHFFIWGRLGGGWGYCRFDTKSYTITTLGPVTWF